MARRASSLFSRIITLVLVAVCLMAVFWIASLALAPVEVPVPAPSKMRVVFDPSVDVSKQPLFQHLEPLGPEKVDVGMRGRMNPFLPVATPVVSTSSQLNASSTSVDLSATTSLTLTTP